MNRPNLIRSWTLYEWLVLGLIVLELAHIVVLLRDSSFPLPLLYGPMFCSLYFFLTGKSSQKIIQYLFISSIPFIGFAVWNLILGSEVPWVYYKWYLPTMVPIQVTFPFLILVAMRKFHDVSERNMLLKQQMALGIGISVFVGALFLKHYLELNLELNINPIYAIVVALFFSIGLMVNYLRVSHRQISKSLPLARVDEESVELKFDDLQREEYALILTQAMESDKLYLDPRLSLDKLSQHTSLPKSIISSYLHHVLGYSYYEWLATYRIQHAVQLLEEEGSLDYKLEAIAYASGFSSKTTFNRYFKDMMGVLPSLYRDKACVE